MHIRYVKKYGVHSTVMKATRLVFDYTCVQLNNNSRAECLCKMFGLEFDVQVTVHRDKFL